LRWSAVAAAVVDVVTVLVRSRLTLPTARHVQIGGADRAERDRCPSTVMPTNFEEAVVVAHLAVAFE